MSPADERNMLDGLVRIADCCSEALAAAHGDNEVSDGHLQNLNDINLAVWRLRWKVGLFGGSSELAPVEAVAEVQP